jgi:hypothetical protein
MITSLALASTIVNMIWRDNEIVDLSNQTFQSVDIRLNKCLVKGRSVVLRDSDVSLAGCVETIEGPVDMEGGSWRSFPTPLQAGQIGNDAAWWSATNGTTSWIGGSHSAIFPATSGLITITVNKADLKNGLTFDGYKTCLWRIRDSAGKVVICSPWDWTDLGSTVSIRLAPRQAIAAGPGFWSCINPFGFNRNIKYNRFTVSKHKYFSVYFADGATVSNSVFGPATVDYNLGFENCRNIILTNVKAWGNQTVQGNGAAISFLFGIDGLTARGVEVDSMLVTSSGWPVQNVDVENKIGYLDWTSGWYNNIKEAGVLKRDALGVVIQ